LSGKLTPRGPPQTTANCCAARFTPHCRGQGYNPVNTNFFANGMGRGVQLGPPFFFRYPPRPATVMALNPQHHRRHCWPAVQLSWICSFNHTFFKLPKCAGAYRCDRFMGQGLGPRTEKRNSSQRPPLLHFGNAWKGERCTSKTI
jgi:hypothetical protein